MAEQQGQSDENTARCPNDGQSAEWHQQVGGTHYDGSPRTNGEFVGCPFPKSEKAAKRAPVNGPPGGTISWAEHHRAWIAYARTFGTEQGPDRIARRGGFGVAELVAQLGHMPRTWLPGPSTRFLRGVTCAEDGARPGKPSRGESPCCPGAGSMAHVRGCRNHPEADRG